MLASSRHWLAVSTALFLSPSALSQSSAEFSFSLRLDRGKEGPTPAEGAVIWFPALVDTRPAPARGVVRQKDKEFNPHVLVVRKGAAVEFPNEDRIYHNVFSRSPGASFDLGLFRDGASRSVRFDKPGLVRVFCNIHAQMASNVMVLGDVVFATTDEKGSARISGLAPGRHTARIWHEMAGEREVEIEVPQSGAGRLELDLKATSPPPHKNKFGQDYPKSARNVDRY